MFFGHKDHSNGRINRMDIKGKKGIPAASTSDVITHFWKWEGLARRKKL